MIGPLIAHGPDAVAEFHGRSMTLQKDGEGQSSRSGFGGDFREASVSFACRLPFARRIRVTGQKCQLLGIVTRCFSCPTPVNGGELRVVQGPRRLRSICCRNHFRKRILWEIQQGDHFLPSAESRQGVQVHGKQAPISRRLVVGNDPKRELIPPPTVRP